MKTIIKFEIKIIEVPFWISKEKQQKFLYIQVNGNYKKSLTFENKKGYNKYNNKDTKSILSNSNVSRNPICGVEVHRCANVTRNPTCDK